MQTIVIGHKNPDMDSICSAIGYARLKQLQGVPDVIAARAGNTNARIDYVLRRFGVEPPVFLSDVSPRVSDVMEPDTVSARADSAVYEAIQLITEKELRGLPIVDADNRCMGLLSAFKVNHYLFRSRSDAASARMVLASLKNILETFGGRVVTGELSCETTENLLMVGAMNLNNFSERLKHYPVHQIILFVGDREDIMLRAIESRVRAIVVTGELTVSDGVQQAARDAGVPIFNSPHDTATTVLLARGAVRVDQLMESFTSFSPDTPLEEARDRVAASTAIVFPVIGEEGRLEGVLSKSDFIKPIQRQLVLVDHNELSHAVPGADLIPIIEILDHHRIGGIATHQPIHFWNNPVGSTSTIVALCYQQLGLAIPPEVAGLLMAGLISDTLNLTSPTATPEDARILDHLSRISQTNAGELANQIFSVGSPLLTMTPEEVIRADCKEYEERGRRFAVSQIEELNFARLEDKHDALLEALARQCREHGLFFSALLVTDINKQDSLLLACGAPEFLDQISFPMHAPHVWELAGIVSRKKQLLPYLLQCLAATPASRSGSNVQRPAPDNSTFSESSVPA